MTVTVTRCPISLFPTRVGMIRLAFDPQEYPINRAWLIGKKAAHPPHTPTPPPQGGAADGAASGPAKQSKT